MSERVLLLHGLWMRGAIMTVLRQRLQQAGFVVEYFEYSSASASLERSAELLRARMRELLAPVHLVGHSLGGLLALQACRDAPDLPGGRIVCLGSPLNGSMTARQLAGWGVGRWMVGRGRDRLARGVPAWDGSREVGVIAGSMRLGVGTVIAKFDGDHDGTVTVAETRLQGITDHCVVAASHTGLPFSAVAAEQVLAFLRDGRFSTH